MKRRLHGSTTEKNGKTMNWVKRIFGIMHWRYWVYIIVLPPAIFVQFWAMYDFENSPGISTALLFLSALIILASFLLMFYFAGKNTHEKSNELD